MSAQNDLRSGWPYAVARGTTTEILARNCANRSLPVKPVALFQTEHDSVSSVVR
jgi:hypothetical protein